MEEGDIVLGTVEKVSPTVTQVRLENGKEATLISSEIAPGRIKHLRQYVVPNKKIVCKILELSKDHIRLSLRRVSAKEKKEMLQSYKQKQATSLAFKQILGKDEEKIKEKILNNFEGLLEFIDAAREDRKLIPKYIPKKAEEAFLKIIDKKRKKQELKQLVQIKCLETDGVKRLRKIFEFDNSRITITYISAGDYKLKLLVDDFKQGKKEMNEIVEELEKRAKKHVCEISMREEK